MLKHLLWWSVMAEVKAYIAHWVNQPPQEIGNHEYDPDPAHCIWLGSTLPPISLLHFLCIVFPSRLCDVDTDQLIEAFQWFLYQHFPSLHQPGIIWPQVQHLPHFSMYTVSIHPKSLQHTHTTSRSKRLKQPTFHMSQLSTPLTVSNKTDSQKVKFCLWAKLWLRKQRGNCGKLW